ncbi:glutamate receptor 1-like [Styela clava]
MKGFFIILTILLNTINSTVLGGTIFIDTAIIYDQYYESSLPSFRKAIDNSDLEVNLILFDQRTMTNIVGEVNQAKVSSLFIMTQLINCTAMVELKKAVTVFFIGMMRDHCDPLDDYLMYMYPSHYDVMRAMYDGIAQYDWKTAAVFYDGSEDLAFGYQDLDVARQRGLNLQVYVIPEDEDATWDILKSVRLLGYRTYILLCDYKLAASVMTKAVFLSMVSEVNHWIVPNLETHPILLQDFLESSVRLTLLSAQTIRKVLEYHFNLGSPERVARDAVITAITTDSLNLMKRSCNNAIVEGCFAIPLSDNKQCGIDQGAKSVEISQNFYSIGTCTEIYMRWLHDHGPTRIQYFEHHLGNPKGNVSFVGYWKYGFEPKYVPFVQAAIVFPEEPLVVGIVYDPPWVKWHVNENTNETTYEGFLMDLLVTLSSQLNFKYRLEYNDILNSPEHRPNGSNVDDEVNRMLKKKQVDFFLQKRPIHGGKLETEELSVSFQQVYHFMVTLSSGNEAPVNIWQFLAPFTLDSWIVLWASLVFVSVVLALVNQFNPFEWRKQALDETNEDVDVENFNKLGIGNSIWMAYAGIVGQGVDVEPLSYAGRIITGTWWYFTMLVIAAYTANLTAFLTQEFAGDISNLENLLEQVHYSYGVLADSDINQYFLPHATSEPYTTVWNYLQENPENVFNSTEEILKRVSEKGFYFLAPFGEVANVEQSGCDYARVGEGFWEYQYGLPFQLLSKYTPVFNDAIASLRDDGTLQELESKWFNFRGECKEATFDIEANRLGIGNLGGMFIFLVMGSLISILVHIGEILWSKRYRIRHFRDRSEKKEKKEDPVSEMKRQRERDRKELDDKIEEWEGGFDYWMNRMDHINKTLKSIDDQNKRHVRQIRGEHVFDSDEENVAENFSWWTKAFQTAFGIAPADQSTDGASEQENAGYPPEKVANDDEETPESVNKRNTYSDIGTGIKDENRLQQEFAENDLPIPVPEQFFDEESSTLQTPPPSAFTDTPTPSEVKAKKIKKMLSFSQRKKAKKYQRY